jgi:shikimate kinase
MQRNRKMTPHDTARSLVLVGMMGVGKTTVGRRLALRLGRPFVDADEAIELAAGMTIQEMFDRYGEAAFRDGERRVIARLIEGSPKVIATGGGAFVHPDTRALILERATAIWLDADLDPRTVLSELATTRNPYYAMAPVHVVSTSTPHEATVDSILEALESCG